MVSMPDQPRTSYLVARLDRLIRARLVDALRPFEVTVPQYTLLSVLDIRPGLSNAQLARRSYISAQAMHQLVNGLEAEKETLGERLLLDPRVTIYGGGREDVQPAWRNDGHAEGDVARVDEVNACGQQLPGLPCWCDADVLRALAADGVVQQFEDHAVADLEIEEFALEVGFVEEDVAVRGTNHAAALAARQALDAAGGFLAGIYRPWRNSARR